jgi:hypothetical protein
MSHSTMQTHVSLHLVVFAGRGRGRSGEGTGRGRGRSTREGSRLARCLSASWRRQRGREACRTSAALVCDECCVVMTCVGGRSARLWPSLVNLWPTVRAIHEQSKGKKGGCWCRAAWEREDRMHDKEPLVQREIGTPVARHNGSGAALAGVLALPLLRSPGRHTKWRSWMC